MHTSTPNPSHASSTPQPPLARAPIAHTQFDQPQFNQAQFDQAPVAVEPPATIALGPDATLSIDDVERLAHAMAEPRYTKAAHAAMRLAAETLRAAHAMGQPIYGLTTGFGPHVRFAADADPFTQGAGLISHLAAGWGEPAPRPVVRATIALRAQTIARGHSGIDPAAAQALLDLFSAGLCPAVPTVGSVGASGDLIPLAHVARVLTGQGRVLDDLDRPTQALPALRAAGLEPIALTGRDALAIVNGTSFMTAFAALAAARARRLLHAAEELSGWAYRALAARAQALDPRLHAARGHPGQIESARRIAAEAHALGPFEDHSRPLQEVYSIRCAPQFLGAAREQIDHAHAVIEREINGVNDNPIVLGSPQDPAVLHGGNFQGQQIAFASDTLNAAVAHVAMLIERQLDVLLSPDLNGGAPLLLAWQPGATSGLAGAQITATALTADLRRAAAPSALASIPTNGRNQDLVSMGTMAARVALEQTDRAAAVLAVHALAITQLNFLRNAGRAPGPIAPPPARLPPIEGFRDDRPLHDDIDRLARDFLRPR